MAKVSKKEPIRVLVIGMHDKIGGVETYLMNHYKRFNHNNVQFDFLSTYDELCFEKDIKSNGGIIHNIMSVKKNPFAYFKKLRDIIVSNNYKVVYINMLSAANILPVIISKICKVDRIILHSHNANIPSGFLRKILHKINKPFLNFGTDFWACSEKAGNWLYGKHILNKNQLVVINNAIALDSFSFNMKKRNDVRQKLNVSDKVVIGHIGRFSYQKNHEFLIDFFKELHEVNDNVVLLLIGEGELKDQIHKTVKDYNLEESIFFLGTTNDVGKYINAMDIFVLPSRFEGLPVTGIETQVNGIVCFFSEEITHELKLNNNVNFLPLEKEKWVSSVAECIKLENYKKRVKPKLVEENFDIVKQSELLEKRFLDMHI